MKKNDHTKSNGLLVLIVFAISFIAMGILFSFPKRLMIYLDELYYYDIAKNLYFGNGIKVRMADYNFQKILYSIVIMPAFYFSSAVDRLRAIGWINALLISLGTFPTYGIAKRVFSDKKHIWFSMLLWLVLPVKIYGIGFMSEIIAIPLSLIFVYLYMAFLTARQDGSVYFYGIILSLVQFLLFFNKEITLYVFLAFVVSVSFYAFVNKENRKSYILALVIYCAVFAVISFAVKAVLFSGVNGTYQAAVDDTMGITFGGVMISIYHFIWMFSFLVVGVAFLFFTTTVVVFDKLKNEEKALAVFLLSGAVFCMGAVALMISRYENANIVQARAHLRYIEPLMYVFIIFSISVLERFYDVIKTRWNAVMLITTAFLGIFVGIGFSFWSDRSFADLSSLTVYQVAFDHLHNINQAMLILMFIRIAIAAVFVAMLWLIYKDKKRIFFASFGVIISFCLLNTVVKYIDGYDFYKVDPSLIERFEQAENEVEKLDGRVVYISHTRDSFTERYFDTFFDKDILLLDTRNYYFDGYLDDSCLDIEIEGFWDNAGDLGRIDDIREADYIIAYDNVVLHNVEKIESFSLEENGFILYKNLDPSKIYIDCTWREAVTEDELKNLMFVQDEANQYIKGQ